MVSDLRDLYHAEVLLGPFLKELVNAAQFPGMKAFLESFHKDNAESQEDIFAIFTILREDTFGNSCYAAEGIVRQGREILANLPTNNIKDVSIVSCCRRLLAYQEAVLDCAFAAAKATKRKNIEDILLIRLQRVEGMRHSLNQITEGKLFSKGLYQQILHQTD